MSTVLQFKRVETFNPPPVIESPPAIVEVAEVEDARKVLNLASSKRKRGEVVPCELPVLKVRSQGTTVLAAEASSGNINNAINNFFIIRLLL